MNQLGILCILNVDNQIFIISFLNMSLYFVVMLFQVSFHCDNSSLILSNSIDVFRSSAVHLKW